MIQKRQKILDNQNSREYYKWRGPPGMDNSSRTKLLKWNSPSVIVQQATNLNQEGAPLSNKTQPSIIILQLSLILLLKRVLPIKFSLVELQSWLNRLRCRKLTLMTFFERSRLSFLKNSKVSQSVKMSPTSNSYRRSAATSVVVFRTRMVLILGRLTLIRQVWEGEATVWQLWCHHPLKSNLYKEEVMVAAQELLDTNSTKHHCTTTSFSQTSR